MSDNQVNLSRLFQIQAAYWAPGYGITGALDWAARILPQLTGACRLSIRERDYNGIDAWRNWMDCDCALRLQEAGKRDLFLWRRCWITLLLSAASRLLSTPICDPEDLRAFALQLQSHWSVPVPMEADFWTDLCRYLSSAGAGDWSDTAPKASVLFPLVLSEPVVDAGQETSVILAEFILQSTGRRGGVTMHPEHAPMRCMDATFLEAISCAVRHARQISDPDHALEGVRWRIRTLRPSHEAFLLGAPLRGPSAAGAMALGLTDLYAGSAQYGAEIAVSFALADSTGDSAQTPCVTIGNLEHKIAGCSRQRVGTLLAPKSQQEKMAEYARRHGVELVGADTLGEAIQQYAARRRGAALVTAPRSVAVLYNRKSEDDLYVSRLLESRLELEGYTVFIDRHLPIGIPWATEIDSKVRSAYAVVPLLSATSVTSDMLSAEIEAAAAGIPSAGKPRILPVRVKYDGPLPDRIGSIIGALQHGLWSGPENDDALIAELVRSLSADKGDGGPLAYGRTEPAGHRRVDTLEPFDGPVPLRSR
ncbi:MAG TPA: toll/interleukin-1 receptor domain-containing protein, partial [Chthonomonadales bacterium]|nr:toll/interleukin-1 receptor domain-containing protein [Chthonomonadales bacterium]